MLSIRRRLLLVLTVATLVTSCASTPKNAATSIDCYLNVSSNVNRDSRGRPSPILVSIYGLKSTIAFEAGNFPALQDRAKATLGDDLISFDQLILLPGEHRLIQPSASAEAHSVGIVAGYRELNKSAWKIAVALPAGENTGMFSFWPFVQERPSLHVKLGENGLTVDTTNRTH